MDGFHLEVAYGTPHIKNWNALNVVNEKQTVIAKMLDSPGLHQRGEHDVAKLSQKGKAERNGGEGWRKRKRRRGVEDSRRRER